MRLLDLHLALMARLPVRTIPAREKPEVNYRDVHGDKQNSGRGKPGRTERIHRRIVRMHAAGVEKEHICEALGLSMSCVDRHILLSTAAGAAQRR